MGNWRNDSRANFWAYNDREGYECPDCGRGVNEVEQMEVHHIDRDPENNLLENLVGLCQRCHYKRHGKTPPESLEEWKDRGLALGTA